MNIRSLRLFTALLALLTTACLGRVTLAPHLNRERELAPEAASGRHSALLDRAAAFEKQNAKSRDVHWYRTWRAVAMIGLEQHQQALDLLADIQQKIASAKSSPAQPERLRMFIYDLEARAYLATGRPVEALGKLDRSLEIAKEVSLETSGDCDREMLLFARNRQLEAVATAAGEQSRAKKAHEEAESRFSRYGKCLAAIDYPSLAAATEISFGGAPAVAVAPRPAPPVAAPPPPAPPPPRRGAPPPPPPPPAKAPAGSSSLASIPVIGGQYAPVSDASHRAGFSAVKPLLAGPLEGAKLGVVIRTDGRHHALHVKATKPLGSAVELAEALKSLVIFFENTRNSKPAVTYVLVESGADRILASRQDVFDLFLERVEPAAVVPRLRRVR